MEVQQGREPTDVDFCSIAIDGGLENDILQQRLHTVLKQREQLQHMEIGLRAQEQLHKRGQQIHELERKIEEKERELNAIRLDNEDLSSLSTLAGMGQRRSSKKTKQRAPEL
ncbi:uncharacterized protein Fot_03480 [Forsythia ovata]|uniref:Uncharacterized protein n=1 Tax=Forsythia ovata TaxID=205694 RepID=A0ABD1XAG0_9LAMI